MMGKMKTFFLLWGLFSYLGAERVPVDRVLCVVNGEAITQSDFDEAVQMTAKLKKMGFPLKEEAKEVLKKMVNDLLVRQEDSRQGAVIGEVDVINQVKQMARSNGMKDEDELKRALESNGVSWDYFLKMEKGMLGYQYLRQYLPKTHDMTSDEVRDYYEKHKENFIEDTIIGVKQIFIRKPDDADYATIRKLKEKADAVAKEAQKAKPEDFDSLIKKYSDMDSTEIFWKLERDFETDPGVWETLLNYNKGDVTESISVSVGFFVYKIEEVLKGRPIPLDRAGDLIKEDNKNKEALRQVEDKIKELQKDAVVLIRSPLITFDKDKWEFTIQSSPKEKPKMDDQKETGEKVVNP